MRRRARRLSAALMIAFCLTSTLAMAQTRRATHLGFDRNGYPGDETLGTLRHRFSFTGFWLNTPPGAKRQTLQDQGFGFLVLFNGRSFAAIKAAGDATVDLDSATSPDPSHGRTQ